jgi:hypothetical protein
MDIDVKNINDLINRKIIIMSSDTAVFKDIRELIIRNNIFNSVIVTDNIRNIHEFVCISDAIALYHGNKNSDCTGACYIIFRCEELLCYPQLKINKSLTNKGNGLVILSCSNNYLYNFNTHAPK